MKKQRRSQEGACRGPDRGQTTPRRGQPWTAPRPHLGDSETSSSCPSAYKLSSSRKPSVPDQKSTKSSVAAVVANLDQEGSEALPGTLSERGIITGGLYIAMPAPGVMCE